MVGDITIYITPCSKEENRKKYNGSILKVMEESNLKYSIQTPSSRLHGLIKLEVILGDIDSRKYDSLARDLTHKLESYGIEVKKVVDFKGKPQG
ncbi:MAG: hypothetical protein ACPLXC_01355 [Candidatus Pacearchaeota archaeon]